MWPHVVVEGQVGQPVATLVREVGLGAATLSGELWLGGVTEDFGNPTGPLQAPPPMRAHELLSPAVALLWEAGGAAKISPGVSPSASRCSMGEEPAGVGGLGGSAPVMGR